MATFKPSGNTPWLFYSGVACALLSLFSLWFFLHPNSPWHSRNNYSVAFTEVGNLKVRNIVTVNGLEKGYVKGMDLTDSCVWVYITVLAKVKIPTDSKPRVTNVGLMGERAVDITLGDAKSYHANGARIIGFFDRGSTDIGVLTFDILKDLEEIINIFSGVADSLFSEKKMEEYKKIGTKGELLGNNLSRLASSAETSLDLLIDSLMMAKNNTANIIDGMKTNFDDISNNMDLIKNNFSKLENSLSDLKIGMEKVTSKLDNEDNSVSLILDKNDAGTLKQGIKTFSKDTETIMKKIHSRGLDLNVDIF